jgi:GntR family transcriptional regulator
MVVGVIRLRLDPGSGVAPYQQIVQQVRQAVRLGALGIGDQLPTVKEVVEQLAINPNTVLKAYRALEHEGLCEGRPGVGTFVVSDLPGPSAQVQARLRSELGRWVDRAVEAGLDIEAMVGLVRSVASQRDGEAVA